MPRARAPDDMTLAVLVPVLGTMSETFVLRHVQDLHDAVVVVTRRRAAAGPGRWSTSAPVLELDPLGDAWCGELEQASVRRFLDEHGVTAVLAEFLDVWVGLLPALLDGGARVWAHAHGYDVSSRLRDPWWRGQYAAWGTAEGVVTMSELSRSRLRQLGLERVEVVPYGVDVPAVPPSRPERATCSVLAVGRLVAKKAPQVTVRAFEQAAQARPQLRLSLAGDGPLMTQVRDVAGPQVEVLGAVAHAQVGRLMAAADVFVQHSVVDSDTGDEEGLPVAVLEAMAAGLPVIATRHAGLPEAVLEGVTGLLVDEMDQQGMADAMARLADDRDLRLALGRAGWQRAHDLYTWEGERRRLRQLLGLDH